MRADVLPRCLDCGGIFPGAYQVDEPFELQPGQSMDRCTCEHGNLFINVRFSAGSGSAIKIQ